MSDISDKKEDSLLLFEIHMWYTYLYGIHQIDGNNDKLQYLHFIFFLARLHVSTLICKFTFKVEIIVVSKQRVDRNVMEIFTQMFPRDLLSIVTKPISLEFVVVEGFLASFCSIVRCPPLMTSTSGKVYGFLSALSRPVSPENSGHLAELCSKQTRPSTMDSSMAPTSPNTCETRAREITQDGNGHPPFVPTLGLRFSEAEGEPRKRAFLQLATISLVYLVLCGIFP
ncbi:hypothetical protein WN51_05521 [Melipona quadrifasciata]|uniref:Uncharacterized protein n=1 Tax=Melipona quadrifasciata TaxID=166423 RepID=A0A0M8ZV51_9HYME|nr:hypothetical protein WN51_05521 [Melipona quadrifasciata]